MSVGIELVFGAMSKKLDIMRKNEFSLNPETKFFGIISFDMSTRALPC